MLFHGAICKFRFLSDAVSPVTESTDDIIVDSEDEAPEKVKGRVCTLVL